MKKRHGLYFLLFCFALKDVVAEQTGSVSSVKSRRAWPTCGARRCNGTHKFQRIVPKQTPSIVSTQRRSRGRAAAPRIIDGANLGAVDFGGASHTTLDASTPFRGPHPVASTTTTTPRKGARPPGVAASTTVRRHVKIVSGRADAHQGGFGAVGSRREDRSSSSKPHGAIELVKLDGGVFDSKVFDGGPGSTGITGADILIRTAAASSPTKRQFDPADVSQIRQVAYAFIADVWEQPGAIEEDFHHLGNVGEVRLRCVLAQTVRS